MVACPTFRIHRLRIRFRAHRLRKNIVSEFILGHVGCVFNFSHTSAHFKTHRLRAQRFVYIGCESILGHIRCVSTWVRALGLGSPPAASELSVAEGAQGVDWAFIIVSTDRGLCGGLNANLFKSVLSSIRSFNEKSIKVFEFLMKHKNPCLHASFTPSIWHATHGGVGYKLSERIPSSIR